jgi:hypothetical protein
MVLGSLYLLYMLAYSVFLSRTPAQRALTASFLLSVMLTTWTQFERIGRPVSWRFPIAAAMLACGLWGIVRYTSGGQPLRRITWRSWFIPPPNPFPNEPPDLARRLRADRATARDAEAAADAAEERRDRPDEADRKQG